MVRLAIVGLAALWLLGCAAERKPVKVQHIEDTPTCPAKITGDCWIYSNGRAKCEKVKVTFQCTSPVPKGKQ